MSNLKPGPQAKDPRHTQSTKGTSSKKDSRGQEGEAYLGLQHAVGKCHLSDYHSLRGPRNVNPLATKDRQSRDVPWIATAKTRASNIKSRESATYLSLKRYWSSGVQQRKSVKTVPAL